MSDAYVFLGPALDPARARAELDATYLPPASAGDVARLWARRPRAIGIIDGFFARIPAVWHKEIMWVMERGVHVFGGAGLGALRAAELDQFGMRGVGQVYQAFRDGSLDRDDEVAVACGTAEDGYPARSEPLVSIRATLRSARERQVISLATHDALARAAAALFYPDRSWPALLDRCAAPGADPAELGALRRWLPAGRVDQQAQDAILLLREMRRFLATDPAPLQVRWTMAPTARWAEAMASAEATAGEAGGVR